MSKEVLEQFYSEFLERSGQAPADVRNGYQAMHTAFEDYLCAIEEWTFMEAFMFGYEQGVKAIKDKILKEAC